MTKQTAYLNDIARKSGSRLQFLRQSAFYTHHCWRGMMTSPMKCYDILFRHCRLPRGFHLLFVIFRALILDIFYSASVFQSIDNANFETLYCFKYIANADFVRTQLSGMGLWTETLCYKSIFCL